MLLKSQAVNQENYDYAQQVKASIDRIHTMIGHVEQLEQKKQNAVMQEDYESAKHYKAEIEVLITEAIES